MTLKSTVKDGQGLQAETEVEELVVDSLKIGDTTITASGTGDYTLPPAIVAGGILTTDGLGGLTWV